MGIATIDQLFMFMTGFFPHSYTGQMGVQDDQCELIRLRASQPLTER